MASKAQTRGNLARLLTLTSPPMRGEAVRELQLMLREDWTDAVTIPVQNAKEGMALMAKMYDPYPPQ